jgi:immunity protein Imm1 of predicted polymorphic toxin system
MMGHLGTATYRPEHVKNPVLLDSIEDVDALIDALLASPRDSNLAQVFSLQRDLLPSGNPDHEFMAGVDGDRHVGVLWFAEEKNWVSLGSPGEQEEIAYYLAGHWTGFPGNSEIPVELVRRGIKEFLVSGGQLPEGVEWQVKEYL